MRRQLIALEGRIAHDHGLEPGVLQRILPRLSTDLLGTDPLSRADAISAWAAAWEGGQKLPPTLSDLLPALLNDPYVVVVVALVDVLPRLISHPGTIDAAHLPLLVNWALAIAPSIENDAPGRGEKVIVLLRSVAARYDDRLQLKLLTVAFKLGAELPSRDLGSHLRMTWEDWTLLVAKAGWRRPPLTVGLRADPPAIIAGALLDGLTHYNKEARL